MSIKRILILVLSMSVLLSVLVFALVSSRSVDRYFNQTIDQTYQKNAESIKEYVTDGISQGYLHKGTLVSYIEDPIYYIAVYDTSGALLMDSDMTSGMMGGGMMNGMMSGASRTTFVFEASHMTTETIDLSADGEKLGTLAITRETSAVNTETSRLFRATLLSSGLISMAVVILLAGSVLFLVIRHINRSVTDMVDYATADTRERPAYRISEMNAIAASIESYRKLLAHKERVKKQKLDQVMHDTKTPLTVIKSQLMGIQDGLIPADSETVQSLLESAESLDAALSDISDVVEGQEKQQPVKLNKTDYSGELRKMVKGLEPKFRAKGLKLTLETQGFTIKTNAEALNKAVYNLLLNSYKYTEKGQVSLTTDNRAKTLTIKDTGVGIAKDDLARIFEPYFRGGNARKWEGEGLGLSIVKEQLTLIGAQISVRSELGVSTEFTIAF